MRRLLVLFAFFFVPMLLAQEIVFILPPIVATREGEKLPSPEEREIVQKFKRYYREELVKFFSPDSPTPTPPKVVGGLWWVQIMLMPECESYKGLCISVTIAKEQKKAKAVTVVQIPVLEKFDFAVEAKKAAEKTRDVIEGRLLIARRSPVRLTPVATYRGFSLPKFPLKVECVV